MKNNFNLSFNQEQNFRLLSICLFLLPFYIIINDKQVYNTTFQKTVGLLKLIIIKKACTYFKKILKKFVPQKYVENNFIWCIRFDVIYIYNYNFV